MPGKDTKMIFSSNFCADLNLSLTVLEGSVYPVEFMKLFPS